MDPDYTDEVWRTTSLAAAAVRAHNEELTWTRGDRP
jgi:hypothetical protein